MSVRGGADKMQLVVCFLPDRDKTGMSSSSQVTSPRPDTSAGARTVAAPPTQATFMATSRQHGAADTKNSTTTVAPNSGGLLTRLKSIFPGPVGQSGAEQDPPIECEEIT